MSYKVPGSKDSKEVQSKTYHKASSEGLQEKQDTNKNSYTRWFSGIDVRRGTSQKRWEHRAESRFSSPGKQVFPEEAFQLPLQEQRGRGLLTLSKAEQGHDILLKKRWDPFKAGLTDNYHSARQIHAW